MLGGLDVWNSRNGFLLFKPLEIVFDLGLMYFKPAADGDGFEAHILDESLKQRTLFDPEYLNQLQPQVNVLRLFCPIVHLMLPLLAALCLLLNKPISRRLSSQCLTGARST